MQVTAAGVGSADPHAAVPERLGYLLDHVDEGVLAVTAEGRILFANRAAADLLGRDAAGLVGTDARLLLHEGARRPGRMSSIDVAVTARDAIRVVDETFSRGDGGTVEVRATVRPHVSPAGEHGAVICLVDRSECRAAEAAIASTHDTVSEFAYVASHDLQEPLRKMEMFLGLLATQLGDGLDPVGEDYMRRVMDASARMRALIQGLLAYSRAGTPREIAPVDLTAVARRVAADLEGRLSEVGGTIEIDRLPTVEADATQMRQLLTNLVDNAIKFRRADTAPLIRLQSSEDAHTVSVVVEDNGIGFEQRHANAILRPFKRLHSRAEYPGTGIGLAVCAKIVESLGGRLEPHGRPESGSSFVFTLPTGRRGRWAASTPR